MLGGAVYRIAKWAVVAAVALLIGSQLMVSVSSIVMELRLGHPLPFIGSLVLAAMFAKLSGRDYDWKAIDIGINIIAGISLIISSLSIFMILASRGFLLSILGSGSFIGFLSFLHSSKLGERLTKTKIATSPVLDSWTAAIGNRQILAKRALDTLNAEVLLLPPESIEKIFRLLKERPLLPVAVSRLLDADVLFIRDASNESINRIINLLTDIDIHLIRKVPRFFTQFILGLPILSSSSVQPEYVIIKDEEVIEQLIKKNGIHLTLFSSSKGMVLVVKRNDALGIDAIGIHSPRIPTLLRARNVEHFLQSTEAESNAT